MANGRTMMWSDGTHTVTVLEVQALRLWARMLIPAIEPEGDQAQWMVGFLKGLAADTDESIATMVMQAKREAQESGQNPMSAEYMPMH